MKHLTTLLLAIGSFSCAENKTMESNTDSKPEIERNSEINDFDVLEDFIANKIKFTSDTFEILDHSTDGGELIVYHDSEFDYVVMDFMLWGETGKINYTYWTNKDLKFMLIKKVNYEYDKPYYEKGFKIDSVIKYLTYSQTTHKLFDSDKKEITNKELADSTKKELEEFFMDVAREIEILK